MLKKKYIKDKCVTCKQCMIACAVRHSASKDIYTAISEVPRSSYRLQVSTRKERPHMTVCQNCAKPKCMEACKYGAITKYEDGNVVIDQVACTGCWDCVGACPFGAISMDTELMVAINCDDCRGYQDMACVTACKTQALVYTEPR
ncbi:MAG: 4Fe-4S dicluster domain-containing protein [Candidatus Brocadiales bacterium]|nr:4Fe-4S dicluster domain-containing protein [Candidatus Brocadiales bacterium]